MEYVERLAQELCIDNERDIGLRGTLCTGYYRDARTAQCAEELAGNTWRVLHVLAYDSDGGQSAFGMHGEHGTCDNLFRELLVQYFDGTVGILVAHTDGGGVLR